MGDSSLSAERMATAGFLDCYTGSTVHSYGTDVASEAVRQTSSYDCGVCVPSVGAHPLEEGPGVSESFTLKSISTPAIPAALRKAEHYRLLNDAEQAESISLDILAVDPSNQQALVVLILSMTDQFRTGGSSVQVALHYLKRVDDPYRRHYYEGLIWEREARATLGRPMGSSFAYDIFRSAMVCYERASAMSPPDDDEAILRWNACVRTIERAHLSPRPAEVEQPLE